LNPLSTLQLPPRDHELEMISLLHLSADFWSFFSNSSFKYLNRYSFVDYWRYFNELCSNFLSFSNSWSSTLALSLYYFISAYYFSRSWAITWFYDINYAL